MLKKNILFSSKFDLNLRKKLVCCYLRIIALYDAEIWVLGKVDQKCLRRSEMWCWRKTETIILTEHVINEEVKEERRSYIQ